ncbi:type I restriction enzyme HsdR N-terminal domain-containing protein [Roseivivax sp. GX 12232]|uniref:type I restriction endonuclease n=1 Tax=Roseivivax sp. GX 12232 TaxID=2900547 RepID=UPI001E42AC1C|nr:type I restriction enzyme HsdR N-terminal domain-containing protein [Roseivivax sp. GX 12232]
MSLDQLLSSLSERVREHASAIATEEAAKTSIILPMLQGLGYDVFNPAEVVPEFTADTPGKKGEKVDYAVVLDGEVRILIEAKGLQTKLEQKHLGQLYRYFSVTNTRFAILTNGQVYQFFSDLEEPNKLDSRPFFTFDLLDFGPNKIAELRKFERSNFDVDKILANAEKLKYVSAIKAFLAEELDDPSEDFVKLVASKVYDGRISASVREMVGSAIRAAFNDLVRDGVRNRLSTALNDDTTEEDLPEVEPGSDIVTTQEEIEGMLTIRAIVRDVIDAGRVDLRDAKSYCAVLVDANNRKPLARLHLNRKQWYVGLFDTEKEERVPIESLNDLFAHSERLRATAARYTA